MANDSPRSVLLVHGKLYGADLLVVRIDEEGNVLPPLIIFQDFDWDSDSFCRIITKEPARMPLKVKVDFWELRVDFWERKGDFWNVDDWEDKESRTCLHKYFGRNGFCVKDIGACIILPLDPKLNDADGESSLVDLLDLKSLLKKAWERNDKWCSCQKLTEEDDIILCDNTRCKIGWYHMGCLGLPSSEIKALWSHHEEWYCEACQELREEDRVKTTYDNENFDKDIFQASDERIQRARTLWEIWDKHDRPAPDQVHKCVKKIEKEWDQDMDEIIIPIQKFHEIYGSTLRRRRIAVGPSIS
jgi:hypothetical protein